MNDLNEIRRSQLEHSFWSLVEGKPWSAALGEMKALVYSELAHALDIGAAADGKRTREAALRLVAALGPNAANETVRNGIVEAARRRITALGRTPDLSGTDAPDPGLDAAVADMQAGLEAMGHEQSRRICAELSKPVPALQKAAAIACWEALTQSGDDAAAARAVDDALEEELRRTLRKSLKPDIFELLLSAPAQRDVRVVSDLFGAIVDGLRLRVEATLRQRAGSHHALAEDVFGDCVAKLFERLLAQLDAHPEIIPRENHGSSLVLARRFGVEASLLKLAGQPAWHSYPTEQSSKKHYCGILTAQCKRAQKTRERFRAFDDLAQQELAHALVAASECTTGRTNAERYAEQQVSRCFRTSLKLKDRALLSLRLGLGENIKAMVAQATGSDARRLKGIWTRLQRQPALAKRVYDCKPIQVKEIATLAGIGKEQVRRDMRRAEAELRAALGAVDADLRLWGLRGEARMTSKQRRERMFGTVRGRRRRTEAETAPPR